MEIRKASAEDLDLFLTCRRAFLEEVTRTEESPVFWAATRTYLEEHLRRDDAVVLLAMEGETLAGACLACLQETLPLPHCPSGRTAELLNVYIRPPFRRQGCAQAMLRRMMAELCTRGVEKLTLFYTDAGYPLYRKLGFTPMERWMEIRLSPVTD